MAGTPQPLDQKFAIVGPDGRPTDFFTRWAQQRQLDISSGLTLADLQAYLTAHVLIPGVGIQLSPSGDIGDHVTINADAQTILDEITATRGAILYRGLLGWSALLPGSSGQFLKTNGAGADPVWAAAGGGGGSTPTLRATNSIVQNSSSTNLAWPAGTVAGDVVILYSQHGFSVNTPAGWIVVDSNNTTTVQGCVFAKIMTAADITAGSVTVTFTGGYWGSVSLATIDGTTMASIRGLGVLKATTASQAVANAVATNADLVLFFLGNRGNSSNSASNSTQLFNQSAADASLNVRKWTGTTGPLGLSETATYSSISSGSYQVAIALRGP